MVTVVIAAVFAVPLLFALSLSLRQIDRTLPTTMEWLPNPIVLGNYGQALADGNLIRYGLNSLLVVAVALPVTLVVASWAGLAMARSGPAVQRRMVAFCVVALLVPHSMIWLPRFLMVKWAGLIDTPFALMLPALMGTSPLFALLFYWAFGGSRPTSLTLPPWTAPAPCGCGGPSRFHWLGRPRWPWAR